MQIINLHAQHQEKECILSVEKKKDELSLYTLFISSFLIW